MTDDTYWKRNCCETTDRARKKEKMRNRRMGKGNRTFASAVFFISVSTVRSTCGGYTGDGYGMVWYCIVLASGVTVCSLCSLCSLCTVYCTLCTICTSLYSAVSPLRDTVSIDLDT
jgi:hypothetical protein